MIINAISAVDFSTYGIGYEGKMPWHNKEDLKWFKQMTVGNAVIMGWTTFMSLGKPLKDRLNIVISHEKDAISIYDENKDIVRNARSIEESIKIAENEGYKIIYVIGGASIYKQFFEKDLIDTLYINFVDVPGDQKYDTYFPFNSLKDYRIKEQTNTWVVNHVGSFNTNYNGLNIHIIYRNRSNSMTFIPRNNKLPDLQYLHNMENIIECGNVKHTRAGKTKSIFPVNMSFALYSGLPILTTKKVYTQGCIAELLWFIQGKTNIKYLLDNNTHIWDDDAYRYYKQVVNPQSNISKEEFLEKVKNQEMTCFSKIGKQPEVYTFGDLGPVYGKQWNNWDGINQLENLIDKLKKSPDDRRLMISAWNVGEIEDMALPPCHYMSQWYVDDISNDVRLEYCKNHPELYGNIEISENDNQLEELLDNLGVPKKGLSVLWSQRSVDYCLGFPYNLLSYSILCYMIAQQVNMIPYQIHCSLGDTHIYENQIDDIYKQLYNNPYLFKTPQLRLNKKDSIYDYNIDDIKIDDYHSYPTIKYKLSVGL